MPEELTRSYFYRFLSNAIEDRNDSMIGDIFSDNNVSSYRNLFSDSFRLLYRFDMAKQRLDSMSFPDFYETYLSEREYLSKDSYFRTLPIFDPDTKEEGKPLKKKNGRELRALLVKAIIEIQNGFIKGHPLVVPQRKDETPQTFLSYAYDDRGLSLCLFVYFLTHKGYLHVDWMHNGRIDDGDILKTTLSRELSNSQQLLFIRSLNSELEINGNKTIRQWCAWEIGNYYSINKDEFYYCSLGGAEPTSSFLSSFHKLTNIVGGKMVK